MEERQGAGGQNNTTKQTIIDVIVLIDPALVQFMVRIRINGPVLNPRIRPSS